MLGLVKHLSFLSSFLFLFLLASILALCHTFLERTHSYTMPNLSAVKSVRIALVFSALLLILTFRNSAMEWYRQPKPRYIFVDLGANGADSFEAFLQNPGAKFHYDFPRPTWAKHEDAGQYL